MRKLSLLCVIMSGLAAGPALAQYSNAVQALNPIGYWPLNETQSPGVFIATNSGTLGALANGYFNDPLFIGGGGYIHNNLYNGTQPGVTSDGDAAAGFNGGAVANDNDGFLLIPQINKDLNVGKAFTSEIWVKPGGGDPNDASGASYASTEWAALIKQGGGGYAFTENGDSSGNVYGYTISMAGIYSLGAPVGWYGGNPYSSGGPPQLQTNATWVVDIYGGNGGNPTLEFDVPFQEPTPQWFHLVLTYDGTNANFYTNGVLAATTVPGSPQSTNKVFAPGNPPVTTPTGAYAFTTVGGVNFAADTINPLCIGDIQENSSISGQGYPQTNATGFNCQIFNGSVDEAAVYTNALSAATVAQHFADATAVNTQLYTNDVLSAKPIVYLRFDEPASNFVEPADGSRPVAVNHGTMGSAANGLYEPGSTPASAGPAVGGFGSPSYAVQMNGLGVIDAGASALGGTGLDPQGAVAAFSASLWFRANPADNMNRFQGIAGRGDHAWRFSLDGNGHARWNPGNNPELHNSLNLNDGAWHQLVGTSDGTNANLYVDGLLAATGTGVGSLSGTPFDLIIGGAPDYLTASSGRRIFDGLVTQVAFFGATLTSNQVQTLYNSAAFPPFISQQPAPTNIIAAGSSISLTVAAGGSTPLSYSWFVGTNLVSNVAGNISGATTSTLTISNAAVTNSGNYTAVASNFGGSATSSVSVLTVTLAPLFITQPAPTNAAYYVGNKAVYKFSATGVSPLAYQLYQNSAPISGATSSNFSFNTISGTNHYYLVVTNAFAPPATSSVLTVVGQAAPAGALVVNFAVAPNSTGTPYAGQGAYSDPGNNVWNPVPQTSGTASTLATNSAGGQTLVTASLIFGFNNGAGGATNGTPGYLESFEDAVNTGNVGIGNATTPEGQLTINDLPQGAYTLYLYGANYDGNRGSIFSVNPINGGAALGGTNQTQNGSVNGVGAVVAGTDTFALGDNYVVFTGVVADAFGNITVTYVPNTNALSGNTGEAPFNGVQAIRTSVSPPTLTIQGSGTNVTITWTPIAGVLQSATNLPGTFTDLSGATSPYITNLAAPQLYFRVRLPQ